MPKTASKNKIDSKSVLLHNDPSARKLTISQVQAGTLLASAVQQSVIVVGDKKFQFKVNDPIFKMDPGDAPRRDYENDKNQCCYVCEASFKVKSSSSVISNNK